MDEELPSTSSSHQNIHPKHRIPHDTVHPTSTKVKKPRAKKGEKAAAEAAAVVLVPAKPAKKEVLGKLNSQPICNWDSSLKFHDPTSHIGLLRASLMLIAHVSFEDNLDCFARYYNLPRRLINQLEKVDQFGVYDDKVWIDTKTGQPLGRRFPRYADHVGNPAKGSKGTEVVGNWKEALEYPDPKSEIGTLRAAMFVIAKAEFGGHITNLARYYDLPNTRIRNALAPCSKNKSYDEPKKAKGYWCIGGNPMFPLGR